MTIVPRQVVILFGPPGSGKGTQGELLSEKLNLYYFETSKILETKFKEVEGLPETSKRRFVIVKKQKFDILQEEEIWKKGILCTPLFVAYLVKLEIKKLHESGKNLLFAGSPRTLEESREIVPLLKKLYGIEHIKVIYLELSPEQTIFRNSHRRICTLMRHPILYTKETLALETCPLDGSKLVRRKGLDDPETIKVRLEQFKERTFPLLQYFEAQGIAVKKVNGEQAVAEVYGAILKALT